MLFLNAHNFCNKFIQIKVNINNIFSWKKFKYKPYFGEHLEHFPSMSMQNSLLQCSWHKQTGLGLQGSRFSVMHGFSQLKSFSKSSDSFSSEICLIGGGRQGPPFLVTLQLTPKVLLYTIFN